MQLLRTRFLLLRFLNYLLHPERQTDEEMFAYHREKASKPGQAQVQHLLLPPLPGEGQEQTDALRRVHQLAQDGRISSLIRTIELPSIKMMKGATMHAITERK